MKKIFLALIVTIFGAFFGISAYAGEAEVSEEKQESYVFFQEVINNEPNPVIDDETALEVNSILRHMPVKEGIDRLNPIAACNYFEACVPYDESGQHIYPDTYDGSHMTVEGDTFVIMATTSDFSEYQFLQDEFPCIVFEQVKFPLAYLWSIVDHEYYDLKNSYVGVNIAENHVVMYVDAETLSEKTNDPDSPVVYELRLDARANTASDWIYPETAEASAANEPADEKNQTGTIDPTEVLSQTVSVVRGGQALENRGKYGDALYPLEFTAGIGCTTNSGKNGLVVNGHNMAVGDLIYLDDVQIGKVTFVQFTTGIGDYYHYNPK